MATINLTVNFSKFGNVGDAFANLTSTMRLCLSTAHFVDLRRACVELMKYKLPQFSLEKIKSSRSLDDLFDVLADTAYWSWIDVRLLGRMAAASRIEESENILKNYKQSVFSKKLVEVMPKIRPKQFKKYFAALTAKVERDASEMTVNDLLEWQDILEKVIMDIGQGSCVINHIKPKSCIEVHLYIPIRCVDDAYQSGFMNSHKFNEIQLLWLEIAHYPVIHDPITSPEVPLPPPLKTGEYHA